jgi:hypothetical protein
MSIELSPIENAVLLLKNKTQSMKNELNSRNPRLKILQRELQGSLLLQVNAGPLAIMQAFLKDEDSKKFETNHRNDLADVGTTFSRTLIAAVAVNKRLIGPDQVPLQEELERQLENFRNELDRFSILEERRQARERELSDVEAKRKADAKMTLGEAFVAGPSNTTPSRAVTASALPARTLTPSGLNEARLSRGQTRTASERANNPGKSRDTSPERSSPPIQALAFDSGQNISSALGAEQVKKKGTVKDIAPKVSTSRSSSTKEKDKDKDREKEKAEEERKKKVSEAEKFARDLIANKVTSSEPLPKSDPKLKTASSSVTKSSPLAKAPSTSKALSGDEDDKVKKARQGLQSALGELKGMINGVKGEVPKMKELTVLVPKTRTLNDIKKELESANEVALMGQYSVNPPPPSDDKAKTMRYVVTDLLTIITKQLGDIETSLTFMDELSKLIALVKIVKKVLDMVKAGLIN